MSNEVPFVPHRTLHPPSPFLPFNDRLSLAIYINFGRRFSKSSKHTTASLTCPMIFDLYFFQITPVI